MRPGGQLRMGYYPADPQLAGNISRMIEWPADKPAFVLDPCCGCGEALQTFGPAEAKRFGIELARNRYEAAAATLPVCINAAFEQAAITERCFSACWLNPPYDDELGGGKRTELAFVQRTTPLLVEGGVLVFFMSERACDGRMEGYLSAHYDRLGLYRHPPTDLPGYSDTGVVIFMGTRRRQPGPAGELPPLADLPEGERLWTAPPGRTPRQFAKTGLTDEELCDLAAGSSLFHRAGAAALQMGRPLLPLKLGHIPMVLASGRLNGRIGDHIARAKINKVWKTIDSKVCEDSKGKEVTYDTQRQTVKLSIRCLARRNGAAGIYDFA